jgi:hypothetical protein
MQVKLLPLLLESGVISAVPFKRKNSAGLFLVVLSAICVVILFAGSGITEQRQVDQRVLPRSTVAEFFCARAYQIKREFLGENVDKYFDCVDTSTGRSWPQTR